MTNYSEARFRVETGLLFCANAFRRRVSDDVDSVLTTSHSLLIDSWAASAILGPMTAS